MPLQDFVPAFPLTLLSPYASQKSRRAPCEGLFLKTLGAKTKHISLQDPKHIERLRSLCSTPERVFVFWRAKPALLRLLSTGIDVHRPICVFTCEKLLGRKTPIEEDVARSKESAEDRLNTLEERFLTAFEELYSHPHRAVARLECMALRSFAALEHRGLYVDKAQWKGLVDNAREEAQKAKATFFELLGDRVPKDLFGQPDLNLEHDESVKKTLEGLVGELPNLTKYTLKQNAHPAALALVQYREANKVVSTYGESFLSMVDDKTQRLHARFIPLGASTGRVASREPNLQNLPSGEAFHKCIRAPEGRMMVTADYATCELRILAELSKDPVFADAFSKQEDLHSRVASEIFGVVVSKTQNPELRARAKAINFGLVYGMGVAALAGAVGVSEDEAKVLLDKYFRAFPKIKGYLEGSVDKALKQGFAQTLLGRQLRFDQEVLDSDNARGELSRIAKNMPIQGSSADMTKLAMIRVHEVLSKSFDDAGLVNTVHDELVVECRKEDGQAVARVVERAMSDAHSTLVRGVPPMVDVHLGEYWNH